MLEGRRWRPSGLCRFFAPTALWPKSDDGLVGSTRHIGSDHVSVLSDALQGSADVRHRGHPEGTHSRLLFGPSMTGRVRQKPHRQSGVNVFYLISGKRKEVFCFLTGICRQRPHFERSEKQEQPPYSKSESDKIGALRENKTGITEVS